MLKYLFFTLLLGYSLVNCQVKPKQTVQNCFTPQLFEQVKKYIQTCLLRSSMGTKCYVEYPPSPDNLKTNKQLPKNFDKIYDIQFNETLQQIICINTGTKVEYIFEATRGLIYKKKHSHIDRTTAQEFFCYLVTLAQKERLTDK